jgi:hypothetical protein
MNRITASSLDDLLAQLRGVRDQVARRGMGRHTEDTERWVMKHLIASLATAELLHFPLAIEQVDRPDITVESNGVDIGIELMELVPAAYARAVAIANSEFPTAIVDQSVFGWGMTWTSNAIRRHLKTDGHRLSGDGWAGDAVEREWATAVRSAIDKKTERLNSPGFTALSENWLGTYASSPGPIFDASVAAPMLKASDLRRPRFSLNFGLAANLVNDSCTDYLGCWS